MGSGYNISTNNIYVWVTMMLSLDTSNMKLNKSIIL